MRKQLYITDKQLNLIKESIYGELSYNEIKALYRVFNAKGAHYDWAKRIGINPNDSRKEFVLEVLCDYHGGIYKIFDKIYDEISGEKTISEGDYIITFRPDDMYVDSDNEIIYHFFINGDKTFFIHNGKKYPFNADGIEKMGKDFGDEFANDVVGQEVETIVSNYLYRNYTLIYGVEFYTAFSELEYETNTINETKKQKISEDVYGSELTKSEITSLRKIFQKKGVDYKWVRALGIPDRKKYEVYKIMREYNGGVKFVADLIKKSEMTNEVQYTCGGYTLYFNVKSFKFINDEFIKLDISLNDKKSKVQLGSGDEYQLNDKGFNDMDKIEGDVSWEVKYEIEDCLVDYFDKKYTEKYGVLFNVNMFFKK